MQLTLYTLGLALGQHRKAPPQVRARSAYGRGIRAACSGRAPPGEPHAGAIKKQRAHKQDAVHPAIVCEPRVDKLRDAVVDDERVAVVREAGQDHLGL